jgi:hypothetical protein
MLLRRAIHAMNESAFLSSLLRALRWYKGLVIASGPAEDAPGWKGVCRGYLVDEAPSFRREALGCMPAGW